MYTEKTQIITVSKKNKTMKFNLQKKNVWYLFKNIFPL